MTPPEAVTLDDIYRARRAIAPFVRHTPLVPSLCLTEAAGAPVHLKLETTQDIGAFKIRGAANKLLSLSDDERRRGVVAVSTGNHGRGVAAAARKLGIRCTVCMGSLVPDNKVNAIKALDADVRIAGKSQDDADEEARRLIDEDGLVLAHPFDDAHVVAGQGTIGLELLEDLPEVKTALVPLSGGGLIGGIAVALKAASPGIRVVGISMERGAAMIESLAAGRPVPVEEEETLADSLGGGIGLDNRYTFDIVRRCVDETVTLSEEQIARAMAHFFWHEGIVVEGGGAVGAAAILEGLVDGLEGPVAVVVSGRNVDMNRYLDIVEAHRPA